jgi:carbonic anhydrase
MKSLIAFLIAVALSVLAACGSPSGEVVEPQSDHPPEGHASPPGHAGEAHWGYTGEIGPAHWADLSPEFRLCGSGTQQSPIDLRDAVELQGPAVERRLGPTVLSIEQRAGVMGLIDNGHTIQITNDVEVHIEVDGEQFDLVQYHFHAPSEHTIDGRHSPLEAHLVHKSAAGNLAVVGMLFEEGEHDPVWDPILEALPSGPGGTRHIENLEIDPDELKPIEGGFYRYEGSLTTPPCSERVHWIIMARPLPMSMQQLEVFASHLHDNHRPVQPCTAAR